MPTLQEELNNEFAGKTVTITPSADNKEWTIKVEEVEEIVPAGKDGTPQVASILTDDEKTALQTNGIAEITGDNITNKNLKDNDKIKAVITGEVPLTTEMTYVTGTKDTGVVVSIDGSEFVWVPVPVVITSNVSEISTSGINLAVNKNTERPMAKLQNGSTENYEGLLYTFSGTTSTYQPGYTVTDTNTYREPAYLSGSSYDDNTTYGNLFSFSDLQTSYNNVVKSINKYGGFYVGRYELGIEENKPVSKPAGGTVTMVEASTGSPDAYRWYGLYNKCKDFSADNLTSTMMWGSQYDAMMNWMAKTGTNIGTIDGTNYNLRNSSFTTGNSTTDLINNIYDLYGCHFEWTIEALNSNGRVYRGGSASNMGTPGGRCTPNPHSNDNPACMDGDNGSRLSLYIK